MVTRPAILADGGSSSFLTRFKGQYGYELPEWSARGRGARGTGHILDMFYVRSTHISAPLFKDSQ